jgi:GNAT superfamily N-acetyltransferase
MSAFTTKASSMPIVMRHAEPGELASLGELCLRSKAVWGYDQTFLDACREELTFRPEELHSTRIAVADTDSGIAGVVQVKVTGLEADLMKLFVEPARLRNGIGRMLMGWAIEQARSMGATGMLIEADPDAAPFYRAVGAYDIGVAASGSISGRLLPKLAFDLGEQGRG